MQSWISAAIRAAETGKSPLFCVHYASHQPATASSATVAVLAVHMLGTQQTRLFSQLLMAERSGISSAEMPAHAPLLEKELLDEWHCFLDRMLSKYPGSYWLHWAMRDVAFGWPLLDHRSQLLLKRALPIAEDRLIDLHATLALEYGAHFVEKPQLLTLARLNQLNHNDVMTGQEEMAALAHNNFAAVGRSTTRKAVILGELALRYARHELVIASAGKRLRRPRRIIHNQHRELLNVSEAASFCGVSRATWYRMLSGLRVPLPVKIGRRVLWNARELRCWIESQCPAGTRWNRERRLHGFPDRVQTDVTEAIATHADTVRSR